MEPLTAFEDGKLVASKPDVAPAAPGIRRDTVEHLSLLAGFAVLLLAELERDAGRAVQEHVRRTVLVRERDPDFTPVVLRVVRSLRPLVVEVRVRVNAKQLQHLSFSFSSWCR